MANIETWINVHVAENPEMPCVYSGSSLRTPYNVLLYQSYTVSSSAHTRY